MLDSISPAIGNFSKSHVNTALGISNLARDVSENVKESHAIF